MSKRKCVYRGHTMIGMQFVLPILLFLLALFGGAIWAGVYLVLILGIPVIGAVFGLFVFANLSFSKHPLRTLVGLGFSILFYFYLFNVLKYVIYLVWHATPFGFPSADTFGAGLVFGAIGFFVPLFVFVPAHWGRVFERLAESSAHNFFGFLLMHASIAWPIMAVISTMMHLKLGWLGSWLWAWVIFTPVLVFIVMIDVPDKNAKRPLTRREADGSITHYWAD